MHNIISLIKVATLHVTGNYSVDIVNYFVIHHELCTSAIYLCHMLNCVKLISSKLTNLLFKMGCSKSHALTNNTSWHAAQIMNL